MAKDLTPPQAVTATNGEAAAGEVSTTTQRFAPVCPISAEHPGARVYRTDLRMRYCKCNTCGHLWKMEDSCSEPQQIEGQACIVIPVKSARLLAKKMRAHSRELQLGLSNTD
jgi:hypothetical protein